MSSHRRARRSPKVERKSRIVVCLRGKKITPIVTLPNSDHGYNLGQKHRNLRTPEQLIWTTIRTGILVSHSGRVDLMTLTFTLHRQEVFFQFHENNLLLFSIWM